MIDRGLIDQVSFLGGLSTFFSRACTINEVTKTKVGAGERSESGSALAGHTNLPCRIAPVTALTRAGRAEREDMTVTTATHLVMLAGSYPLITTAHQAVVDGTTYQITNVVRDSERLVCELEVEVVR